jgi:Flp pilus assembly protein TadD
MFVHIDQIINLIHHHAYKEAVAKLLELLPDAEEPALVYELLGRCFLQVDDYSNAIRSFRYAIEHDPYSADTRILLQVACDCFERKQYL